MNQLQEKLKSDIEECFKHLLENDPEKSEKKIAQEAKEYLKIHLNRGYSQATLDGLQKGNELLNLLEESKDRTIKRIARSALEYLIDPWDIIPDFVNDKGFLDDIYVFELAFNLIDNPQKLDVKQSQKKDWILIKLGGAAGPHLAKRAKELNVLDSYQRKALFDIGKKEMYGYDMTTKQFSFFDTLVNNIINEGILKHECPDSPCKYCSKLEKISATRKFI